MAKPCANCPQLIHSSRTLCNKCAGVSREKGITITTIHTKTRGGMVGGEWVSGRRKAATAGIADIKAMLSP